MPALPLDSAGKYVAAAYIVAFAIILIYVSITATRVGRMERNLGELLELAQRREAERQAALDDEALIGEVSELQA